MATRFELYCYFCGHGCGEVLIPTSSRRPKPDELRAAYEPVPQGIAPDWQGDQPRCPKCGGQMFLERFNQTGSSNAAKEMKK